MSGIRSKWSLDLEERFGITNPVKKSGRQEQGVYALKDVTTDKVIYIGSTNSLYNRCAAYYCDSFSETHEMQNWAHKHKGEWYFDLITSANGLNDTQLRQLESNIIDYYKSIGQAEKNKDSGRKHSEEYKQQYGGKNNPNYGNHKLAGENNPNYGNTGDKCVASKTVWCEELKIRFGSAREAARWLKEKLNLKSKERSIASAILECCNNAPHRKTAYKYHWRFY